MNILIGGSNQILESYLNNSATSESRDLCFLKLSPKSGLQESFADQSLANESFLTEVSNSFSGSQITHLGLIEYLLTPPEREVLAKLGHATSFLRLEEPEKIIQDLIDVLNRASELSKKVVILLDLDLMKSKEFPGKSAASVDGITQNILIEIAGVIARNKQSIEALIITNFNPTVEKEVSSLFLVTFIYRLVKNSLN